MSETHVEEPELLRLELDRARVALEQAQAVNEAADNLCNWIQRELEQHDGWTQFDFLPVKFDLFWFYQLRKALQSAGDSEPDTCEHGIPMERECTKCEALRDDGEKQAAALSEIDR